MTGADPTLLWPWLAAVGLGMFHGLNPGMGWLFAVSNGLQAGRSRAVWRALVPLGLGHFLAMAVVLVPAALIESLSLSSALLRTLAALLLIGFGLYKWLWPRHPRFVTRVGPKRLTLWSFLMASAHGAGLMLLPVFFAVSAPAANAHAATAHGDGIHVVLAVLMVSLHTLAMVVVAGLVGWLVYRFFGLRLLRATWLNVDRLWAGALILVGVLALVTPFV